MNTAISKLVRNGQQFEQYTKNLEQQKIAMIRKKLYELKQKHDRQLAELDAVYEVRIQHLMKRKEVIQKELKDMHENWQNHSKEHINELFKKLYLKYYKQFTKDQIGIYEQEIVNLQQNLSEDFTVPPNPVQFNTPSLDNSLCMATIQESNNMVTNYSIKHEDTHTSNSVPPIPTPLVSSTSSKVC